MTRDNPSNVAASVRQRLLNIIRNTGDNPNLVWTRYAMERLLYRLSVSEYADDFVLKGAMLFTAWTGNLYRPTADMDFLVHGEDSSDYLVDVFRNVCNIKVDHDGLLFDTDTVKVSPIREGQQYQGQRITLVAFLGKARIPIQIDVGYGDIVTPKASKIKYPALLDFPAPSVWTYPRDTVVAEKLQAMVMLGIANSRMKDFYDLYVMARDFDFDGATLAQAIEATFNRRKTEIPTDTPLALTDEFGSDDVKSALWKAFIRNSGLGDVPALPEILTYLRSFLLPMLQAARKGAACPGNWKDGGPWHA